MPMYTVNYSETSEYIQIIEAKDSKDALAQFKAKLHADKYEPEEVVVENLEVELVGI